jgi:protein-S-isoprenylcysteine O-methyltransferase Ste14
MSHATAKVTIKAMAGLANLVVIIGLALFAPAGTLRFVEGWVFLALFFGAALAITLYLARKDPALLERRTQAGPVAEKERSHAGALVLVAGIPMALGTLVGLATFPPFAAVIVWRLLDEERFLVGHLAGYATYRQRTRWRLIPRIW